MSNYRRLISYIYAYEGGVKGKNIGFAKIETRGSQCKVTVSAKRIYVGGNDIGVYLLSGDQEIYLGNIFVRGGSGEFRISVSAEDIENSGVSMDQCYGLTIHDVKNTWRSYTTIWEDSVAHAAEVDLQSAVSASPEKEQEAISEERIKRAVKEIEEEFPLEPEKVQSVSQEPEEEPVSSSDASGEEEESPAQQDQESTQEENLPTEMMEKEEEAQPEESEKPQEPEPGKTEETEEVKQQSSQPEPEQEPVSREEEKPRERMMTFGEPTIPYDNQEPVADETSDFAGQMPEEEPPVLGNPDDLERLRQKEDPDISSHDMIWDKLKREHTRILAFDYEYGCEILTIKPQDIGLLPRDAWVYGNNSFLLHGYYNYRYLIIAKLFNPQGMPRYLLGVPGHYYSNERYMASMFGFPNFVLSKDQPMEDGRFGFWYTDVKLGG
ncbi:DUF6128 domain-containing protein [Lacrimispora sp.]|uniref:DUF6128 domain-containing protein n=1 Tax=Lacrimispora sp. TaxID=2719234 RepID=UPI003460B3A6